MLGGFFGKNLRGLDFYASATTEYAEGTISGACISIVSISVLIALVMSSVSSLMTPKIMTDLIIDAKHSQDKLKVTIDIEFPVFPCALLSVDIENVLKLHKTNIEEGLIKVRLPSGIVHSDKGWDRDHIMNEMRSQIDQSEGCRISGDFTIDRVPGNFHVSMHGYGDQVHQLFMSGGLTKFDLSHKIHKLHFGQQLPQKGMQRTLNNFQSEKQIPDEFLGITYTYFLEIIEKNTIYSNNYHRQSYYYTVRIHELLMASLPMVMFRYQTNPMTQMEVGEYESWYQFLIELVAIVGGIFTVSSIIDQVVHSSIHYLLKKGRMGKLI